MPLGDHVAHWSSYIEEQNQAKSTVISRQGSRSLARLRDEMDEMRRLEAMGTYTDDEINRLARGGKQQGHIVGVGRVLPAWAIANPNMFSQFESGSASGSGKCGDEEDGVDHQDDEDEDGDDDT
nr:F-box domain, leucine-rich repeat domain, L domain-like protein [Tanacetum cinerariifolium]